MPQIHVPERCEPCQRLPCTLTFTSGEQSTAVPRPRCQEHGAACPPHPGPPGLGGPKGSDREPESGGCRWPPDRQGGTRAKRRTGEAAGLALSSDALLGDAQEQAGRRKGRVRHQTPPKGQRRHRWMLLQLPARPAHSPPALCSLAAGVPVRFFLSSGRNCVEEFTPKFGCLLQSFYSNCESSLSAFSSRQINIVWQAALRRTYRAVG